MIEPTLAFWVVALSEAIAVWIIWRLWRSADHRFFKVALTLIAPIPVAGPLIALWIGTFPNPAPRILRDQVRTRSDLYDRP